MRRAVDGASPSARASSLTVIPPRSATSVTACKVTRDELTKSAPPAWRQLGNRIFAGRKIRST
jgi:hypothetical protein